jgi:integrase
MSKAEGVYAYQTTDGRRWEFRHDLPADPVTRKRRQKVRRSFTSQREAKDARAASLSEQRGGSYVEPSTLTVRAFLEDEWLPAIVASGNRKSGTLDQYRIYIKARIVPAIGNIALQELDAATLDRFYAELGQRLAPKSVRNTALMISTALTFAVKRGRIVQNPAKDAEMPRAPRTTMRYWHPEETARFLVSVQEHRLYALWLTLATTGLRRGEVLGLQWPDIDLDAARVSVLRSLVVNTGALHIETPKTDRSVRAIALSPITTETLRRWRKQQLEERLAWGSAYQDSGHVFTREDGAVIDPRLLTRTFTRLVAASGVPMIRLHDVRHSYATAALRAGISAKVVSERLGHASIGITLDTYSHVLPQADEEAAAAVERLIVGS